MIFVCVLRNYIVTVQFERHIFVILNVKTQMQCRRSIAATSEKYCSIVNQKDKQEFHKRNKQIVYRLILFHLMDFHTSWSLCPLLSILSFLCMCLCLSFEMFVFSFWIPFMPFMNYIFGLSFCLFRFLFGISRGSSPQHPIKS